MSDTPTTTEPTTTDAPDVPEAPAQGGGTDWKAEARKWEARAKENRSAARERDALAEALKGRDADLDSLRSQVAGFEHARQVEGWKAAVAAEHKVPVEALRGDSEEEIKAHAEVLAPLLNRPTGPVVPTAGQTPTQEVSPLADAARALFNPQG